MQQARQSTLGGAFPTTPHQEIETRFRREDPCWAEVDRDEPRMGTRHRRCVCKHCKAEWTSNERKRVLDHLETCPNLPAELYPTYQPWRLVDGGMSAEPPPKKRKSAMPSDLGGNAQRDRALARTQATMACAQMIYDMGLPLSTTEHPAFKAFVNKLDPSWDPPSKFEVTEVLLGDFALRKERSRQALIPVNYEAGGQEQRYQPYPSSIQGGMHDISPLMEGFLGHGGASGSDARANGA